MTQVTLITTNNLITSAAYDLGGLVTNSKTDGDIINRNKKTGTLKETHW